jgi:hypothetical protein
MSRALLYSARALQNAFFFFCICPVCFFSLSTSGSSLRLLRLDIHALPGQGISLQAG